MTSKTDYIPLAAVLPVNWAFTDKLDYAALREALRAAGMAATAELDSGKILVELERLKVIDYYGSQVRLAQYNKPST